MRVLLNCSTCVLVVGNSPVSVGWLGTRDIHLVEHITDPRHSRTVDTRVGRKLTLSSDSLCHFSTALTYRIRKAGTIANVLTWDLPLAQFPIWW